MLDVRAFLTILHLQLVLLFIYLFVFVARMSYALTTVSLSLSIHFYLLVHRSFVVYIFLHCLSPLFNNPPQIPSPLEHRDVQIIFYNGETNKVENIHELIPVSK